MFICWKVRLLICLAIYQAVANWLLPFNVQAARVTLIFIPLLLFRIFLSFHTHLLFWDSSNRGCRRGAGSLHCWVPAAQHHGLHLRIPAFRFFLMDYGHPHSCRSVPTDTCLLSHLVRFKLEIPTEIPWVTRTGAARSSPGSFSGSPRHQA